MTVTSIKLARTPQIQPQRLNFDNGSNATQATPTAPVQVQQPINININDDTLSKLVKLINTGLATIGTATLAILAALMIKGHGLKIEHVPPKEIKQEVQQTATEKSANGTP